MSLCGNRLFVMVGSLLLAKDASLSPLSLVLLRRGPTIYTVTDGCVKVSHYNAEPLCVGCDTLQIRVE